MNDFKNLEFTYCSKSYTYSSVDIVKTIAQSFLSPLFLSVLLYTAPLPPTLYLLFPQLLKFFWLLHCPQIPAIAFVAPGSLLLPLGLFGSLLLSMCFLLSCSCFCCFFLFCLHLTHVLPHQVLSTHFLMRQENEMPVYAMW